MTQKRLACWYKTSTDNAQNPDVTVNLSSECEAELEKMRVRLHGLDYATLLFPITKLLFYADLRNLSVVSNCAVTEYESEAERIMLMLLLCKSAKDVQRAAHFVFEFMFDQPFDPERFDDVAREIWKMWVDNGKKLVRKKE